MKKYMCDDCQPPAPCVIEWGNCSTPETCPNRGVKVNWRKVTKSPRRRPRLTVEVFDRPDCPEWARYAGLDSRGQLIYWHCKPTLRDDNIAWTWVDWNCKFMPNYFDATNWRNSLIERPTTVPDWCKVGVWVWTENYGYKRIREVCAHAVSLDGSIESIPFDMLAVARVRPWTFEEAPAMLKLIVDDKIGVMYLNMYTNGDVSVYGYGYLQSAKWETLEQVAERGVQLDGSPCGVMQHLKDGEWVE